METRYWLDEEQREWREFIHGSYETLMKLADVYVDAGWKTWINAYNMHKWMLTVTR